MRRVKYQQEDTSDDSFLDVVANVVGVLIILVMLVGAQASRGILISESKELAEASGSSASPSNLTQDVTELREELKQAQNEVLKSQQEVEGLARQIAKVEFESRAYNSQRVELAMHRSVIEEEIQRRKSLLDEQKQGEFDVQRQLIEAKLDLDKLSQEQLSLVSAPSPVTEVECVPTPLAREIDAQSIHLRLSKGLVSIVPFEALMQEAQFNLEGTRQRLRGRGRAVETFGPLDGYRLKLTIAEQQSQGPIGGPLAGQLQRTELNWEVELTSVSPEFGQNVELALLPNGALRQHLLSQRQQNPTVVVWLYTDSFDEFRPLKRALWEMGFALATRPMSPGMKIKASPHGTRAAVQ